MLTSPPQALRIILLSACPRRCEHRAHSPWRACGRHLMGGGHAYGPAPLVEREDEDGCTEAQSGCRSPDGLAVSPQCPAERVCPGTDCVWRQSIDVGAPGREWPGVRGSLAPAPGHGTS